MASCQPGCARHSGDDVGEVKHRCEEEDFLDAFVVAPHRQQPYQCAADRNRDVLGDVKELEAARNAGKLADDVAEVDQHQEDHDDHRDAQAEFLADQVAESLAGYRAHARAHFLDDDERQSDRNHGPEQRVTELRPGLGVGEDAVGIVVDIGGNETRTEHGEEEQYPGSPAFQHVGAVSIRGIPSLPAQTGRGASETPV